MRRFQDRPGLLLRYKCHIEAQKSSKIVVNYVKIVVLRGFRGLFEADLGGAVAEK